MKHTNRRSVADGGTDGGAGDDTRDGELSMEDPLRSWRVGTRAPRPPDADEVTALVEAVGPRVPQESYTVLRATLVDEDASTRRRVLDELTAEPSVLGTSIDHDVGPDDRAVFDALVAPQHDPVNVATALAAADRVVGVALAEFLAPGDGGAAPELEDAASTFAALKGEIEQVSYEDLVEELEAVGFGQDEDEVDLAVMLEEAVEPAGSGPAEAGLTPAHAGNTPGGAEADGGAKADAPETPYEVPPDVAGGPSVRRSIADGDAARLEDGTLDPNAVLSALLTALETEDLSDAQRTTLRDAAGLEGPTSLRARFEHLQGQVQEVLAYRDALESFIDEVGDDGEGFEELRESIVALEDDLDALEEGKASLAARLSDHDLRLDALEARAEETLEQLEATESDVETLAADLEDAGVDDETVAQLLERQRRIEEAAVDAVERLDDRIAGMESDLSRVREWRDRLEGALLGGDLTE